MSGSRIRWLDDVSKVEERLKSLMLQSMGGDERAYRSLLQEVAALLRAYYRRRLVDSAAADDLTQETLLALHSRRMTYELSRPFTPWLHAIARYKLVDYLRSSRRHRAFSLEEAPEAFLAADEMGAKDEQGDTERLLASVPENQRALVRAVKLEGRSIADVSAATGLSPSTVKVRIHRAIKALRRNIEEGGGQ
jgi:RNA polymerase sigma-70 factor, ECF subfamily